MAKKNKELDLEGKENEKSVGSKIIAAVIVIVIVIAWLAFFGVLIKLDVGGFGSSILRPLLKDVPVISSILPAATEEQVAYENDYPYSTLEDAIARIKELETENASLTETGQTDTQKIQELQAEVDRLKVFEENQTAFEERVKEFEENVVFAEEAPDVEEYKQYYESINPTTAEEIYRQVVEQEQISESVQEKAEIYSKMKAAAAAPILENMTADIDLVAEMLLSMNASQSSAILAEMDATAAAKITKKMFDLDAEKTTDNTADNTTDTAGDTTSTNGQ